MKGQAEMKKVTCLFGLLLLITTPKADAQPAAQSIEVDVCIYAATPSGILAAIAVQREGHSLVIVEPGRWLGGMLGAGLKPLQDCPNYKATGGMTRRLLPTLGRGSPLQDASTRACALAEPFFPPLYVQGLDAEGRPVGNLHFENLTVKDDRNRPILRIRDRKGNGIKAISGEIILKRNGQSKSIAVDDAWLEAMRE